METENYYNVFRIEKKKLLSLRDRVTGQNVILRELPDGKVNNDYKKIRCV